MGFSKFYKRSIAFSTTACVAETPSLALQKFSLDMKKDATELRFHVLH